jgi:cold shock protein
MSWRFVEHRPATEPSSDTLGDEPRGDVRRGVVVVAHGVVRWFNDEKGFGFIAPDDGGTDLFVEYTDIECDHPTFQDGQEVEFEVGLGPRGRHARRARGL